MRRPTTKVLMIAAVFAVLAIVVGGTAAYGYFFNGKEISNNKIKTGNITLDLHGGELVPIDLDSGVNDIMPGNYGTVGDWTIENIGTTHASLFIQLIPNEWDINLGDVLLSSFWLDRDQNGVWSTGDAYFNPDGTYVNFASGDTGAVPAAAFQKMNRWTTAVINTMNVDVGVLGDLEFSWLLPAEVVDTQEKPLMGKSCNFDLLIQLDQYHEPEHVLSGSTSGHSPVTISLYNGGFLVASKTVTGATYSISAPAIPGYTAVFTWDGGSYTIPSFSLQNADVPADLPA